MELNGIQIQNKIGMGFRDLNNIDYMGGYNINQFGNSYNNQQFALEKVGNLGATYKGTTDHTDSVIGSNGLKNKPIIDNKSKLNLIG